MWRSKPPPWLALVLLVIAAASSLSAAPVEASDRTLLMTQRAAVCIDKGTKAECSEAIKGGCHETSPYYIYMSEFCKATCRLCTKTAPLVDKYFIEHSPSERVLLQPVTGEVEDVEHVEAPVAMHATLVDHAKFSHRDQSVLAIGLGICLSMVVMVAYSRGSELRNQFAAVPSDDTHPDDLVDEEEVDERLPQKMVGRQLPVLPHERKQEPRKYHNTEISVAAFQDF